MKKLFALLLLCIACFALSAHAQAVNNRTFTIDPLPTPIAGQPVPTEWRVYCWINPDTSTWNKATALVRTVILPALTTGIIPLADSLTHCAATFAGTGAPEGLYSNVVYAKPFGAPVIKITMDLSILFENFAENGLPPPITQVRVNGVTVQ